MAVIVDVHVIARSEATKQSKKMNTVIVSLPKAGVAISFNLVQPHKQPILGCHPELEKENL